MSNKLPFEGRPYYEIALLRLLCKLPRGEGKAAEVCHLFENEYKGQIPARDYEVLEKAKQRRWEKHVNWCRDDLKRRGFVDMPARGVWRVTKEGRDWVEKNPDAQRLPPLASESSKHPAKARRTSAVGNRTRQTLPEDINLAMLEKTRQSMPLDQFHQVWGAMYDQLLAEERARVITDINQTELGRRARRKVEEIQAFLRGQSNASPKSDVLCDWIHFCYELELFREAASLLQYVAEEETDPAIYRRAKRLAEASRVKLGW